ncbi:MAG: hypothetical protein AAB614_00225 [Patescibacteria group bacterium]
MLQYYEIVKERDGLNSQVKLAMLTRISSKKAEVIEDSPENIALFEDAMKKIFDDKD